MASTGTDVKTAMDLLGQVGWNAHRVADELGVHIRTARRWAAGTNQPADRNRANLRKLVAELAMREYHRRTVTRTARLLERAGEALMSDADRAERAQFEADMRAKYRAIREHNAAQREATVPAPRIADADVFAVVGATDYPTF